MIELESETPGRSGTEEMLARLERLEEHAHHLRVPRAFATLPYALRARIRSVRNRLKESARARCLSPPEGAASRAERFFRIRCFRYSVNVDHMIGKFFWPEIPKVDVYR